MTAHIASDWTDDTISAYCVECFPNVDRGVFATWPLCLSGTKSAELARDSHNAVKHPVFKPAVLTLPDMTKEWTNPLLEALNNPPRTFHVSARDFTDSPTNKGEWDFIPEGEAIPMNTPDEIAAAHDRIRRLQIEALKRDIGVLQAMVNNHKDLEGENNRLKATLEKNRQLTEELRKTIEELMETPDPMPLCKNSDGHNYLPLDHHFVFCNRCGHSIHYKTA